MIYYPGLFCLSLGCSESYVPLVLFVAVPYQHSLYELVFHSCLSLSSTPSHPAGRPPSIRPLFPCGSRFVAGNQTVNSRLLILCSWGGSEWVSIKQQLLRFGIITCPLIGIPNPDNAWVNSGQLCLLLATIIIVLGG